MDKNVEFLELFLDKVKTPGELDALMPHIKYRIANSGDTTNLDKAIERVFDKFCDSNKNEEIEISLLINSIMKSQNKFQKLIQREKTQELLFGRLYQHTPEKFYQYEFAKTGSRTILLVGGLKGKLINRIITEESFEAWKYAYININWKKEGFDYVPIEPIQSVQRNKKSDNLVEVKSGVLDISVGDWEVYTSLFSKEILSDIDRIRFALANKGISHSHAHVHNFCLRFCRNADQTIDFTIKPRVYFIDFDRAELNHLN